MQAFQNSLAEHRQISKQIQMGEDARLQSCKIAWSQVYKQACKQTSKQEAMQSSIAAVLSTQHCNHLKISKHPSMHKHIKVTCRACTHGFTNPISRVAGNAFWSLKAVFSIIIYLCRLFQASSQQVSGSCFDMYWKPLSKI